MDKHCRREGGVLVWVNSISVKTVLLYAELLHFPTGEFSSGESRKVYSLNKQCLSRHLEVTHGQ